MPAKNRIKRYIEDGVYHIYNRGVERRRIFQDDEDYSSFTQILKHFLSPSVIRDFRHPLTGVNGFRPVRPRPLVNLSDEVDLIAYCLMPNHFHLLLKQKKKDSMTKLLKKISTTYAMYFNRRYDRVGPLFQGVYKAALVENDEYLLHVSRYIHLNPTLTKKFLDQYPYSSYQNYIGEKEEDWVKPQLVFDYFKEPENPLSKEFTAYRDFIENYEEDPQNLIGRLTLD